jgi:hypothetical protein
LQAVRRLVGRPGAALVLSIGLALCIIFPSISLWFPRYLFGK